MISRSARTKFNNGYIIYLQNFFTKIIPNSHFEIPHMPSYHYVSLQQRDVEQK